MEKEDKILLSSIQDKWSQCQRDYMVTHSNFLDVRQQSLVLGAYSHIKEPKLQLYGGFDDAERKAAVFLPDYASLPEDGPFALLRFTAKGEGPLSHRDYLGAMVGLGVKRETIGDILVRRDGADIIIFSEMGSFFLQNLQKAGRATLTGEIRNIGDLILSEKRTEQLQETVASLRLDNVVAAAFHLSRTNSVEAIEGGSVFLNGVQIIKVDRQVRQGDKLVVRGRGKVILKDVGGITRKNRIAIKLEKYV